MGEKNLIVGVFSPAINECGGAEWVAINIMSALKEYGHQVIVLSDDPLNQKKFADVFGRKISVDQQMVFPLRFFSSRDNKNIYTNAIKCLVLKSKCDVLVDTFSGAMIPGVDASYFQGFPLLKKVENLGRVGNFEKQDLFHSLSSFLKFSETTSKTSYCSRTASFAQMQLKLN